MGDYIVFMVQMLIITIPILILGCLILGNVGQEDMNKRLK